MCFMLPSSRFVRGCCRPCFKTKTVGAYRIRPPWRRGCMFDGGDVCVVIMSNHPVQSSCHPGIDRTGVGAYRIRPDVGENEMITANKIPPSNMQPRRHEGRMRYAPTHFRSFHG